MKRWSHLALVAGLAMTVTACAGDDARTGESKPAEAAAVGTSGTTSPDADFLNEQISMGEMEIALGKLAVERATNPQVKEYGQMMVRDHQFAGEELKRIAAGNGNAAKVDHDEHDGLRAELSKLSGAEFDKKYMDQMVDDHEKALRDVERNVEEAKADDVKGWATRTVPKVRRHLAQAREIRDSLK